MKAVYTDLHIHTSDNADAIKSDYDSKLLVRMVKEFSNTNNVLLSLTDHNTINRDAYEKILQEDVEVILGVELHVRNYDECMPYHCHMYFDIDRDEILSCIDEVNVILDELYPKKMVNKDDDIPTLEKIVQRFDDYNFVMLPHGGQSHNTFDRSIPKGVTFDTVMERNIYYNQFDGFTSRSNKGTETTISYFERLGISGFINLITCTDNYEPSRYPNSKAGSEDFIPTWMISEPTFHGLRLALSEETRLFYQKEEPSFTNDYIKNAFLSNDRCHIDVDFTPGLNVIIGGSSSGKTLFMDSLYKKITGDTFDENYDYNSFGVEDLAVSNPAKYIPHYINQNYIIKVLDKGNRIGIESIDIIRNTFPGSTELDLAVEDYLAKLRNYLNSLFLATNNIRELQKRIRSIPVFSRIIPKVKFQKNYFETLLPNENVQESIALSDRDYKKYGDYLDELGDFSNTNPFIDITAEIKSISKKIDEAYGKSKISDAAIQRIESAKSLWNEIIEEESSEEKNNRQLRDKLKTHIHEYYKNLNLFFDSLNEILEFSFEYETSEIMAGGHLLKIKNDFKLNHKEILDAINSFRRNNSQLESVEEITPEALFQEQFNQIYSNDYQNKIYEKLAEKNKKTYDIRTKDGDSFEDLSPGWKTAVLLDIILNYDQDNAPIFIDQPEDNLATNYINKGLVEAIRNAKNQRQIIVISHNATIPMLADAQNIILCTNKSGFIDIQSAPMEGKIHDELVIDKIVEITDGGKSAC